MTSKKYRGTCVVEFESGVPVSECAALAESFGCRVDLVTRLADRTLLSVAFDQSGINAIANAHLEQRLTVVALDGKPFGRSVAA